MRNYEVVFIVHPDLDENALKGVVERVQGWITDAGGSVDQSRPCGVSAVWLTRSASSAKGSMCTLNHSLPRF